jgi:hypothetical protein
MKQRLSSESKQRDEVQADQVAQQRTEAPLEFASVEELIRYDMSRTEPPAGLRDRVLRDIEAGRRRAPWWKRWFS